MAVGMLVHQGSVMPWRKEKHWPVGVAWWLEVHFF
jgi:hypothetical protein